MVIPDYLTQTILDLKSKSRKQNITYVRDQLQ